MRFHKRDYSNVKKLRLDNTRRSLDYMLANELRVFVSTQKKASLCDVCGRKLNSYNRTGRCSPCTDTFNRTASKSEIRKGMKSATHKDRS